MNVNRDLKLIWWAPERTGTKITAEIFKKFGFEHYNSHKKEFTPLSEVYHSHEISFPEEFQDYKVISNIRNPYDRVLSFYLNFTSVGRNFVYLKNEKDRLVRRMDLFVLELFQYSIYEKKLVNQEREVPLRDYVISLNFDGKIPDHFIRMENLEQDLSELDFVRNSSLWDSGEIQEMIYDNKFKIKRPFSFDEIYSFESANRVYNYHQKHFFICGYDPFSFTKNELSEEEKFNFIHEIF